MKRLFFCDNGTWRRTSGTQFDSLIYLIRIRSALADHQDMAPNRQRSTVCSYHNITAEHPHEEVYVPYLFVAIHCEMEALKMGEAHEENERWGGGRAACRSWLVMFKHVDVSNSKSESCSMCFQSYCVSLCSWKLFQCLLT